MKPGLVLRPLVPADLWACVNSHAGRVAVETPTPVAEMVAVSQCRTIVGADRHPLACLIAYPSAPGRALFVFYLRADFTIYEREAVKAMRRFLNRVLKIWPVLSADAREGDADTMRLLRTLGFKAAPAGLQVSPGRVIHLRGARRLPLARESRVTELSMTKGA